jgi:septal ring factor EnvC (AmiA/AmiB activator)
MHYKDTMVKLEAKVKQFEIEKNQLQQNVFKLTETNKQLERDMLMIAPIVEEKDRLIGEQNNMIKQMRDQFETEKLKQREEYMRAFNRMKEELAMVRSSTSGKSGQLE